MEMRPFPCPVCKQEAKGDRSPTATSVAWRFMCPRCGEFEITDFALNTGAIPNIRNQLYLLSGFLRERTLRGQGAYLIPADVFTDEAVFKGRIASSSPRTVQERLERLLVNLEAISTKPGETFSLHVKDDYPLAYSQDPEEFEFYVSHLRDSGFIEYDDAGTLEATRFRLTVNAWNFLRKQRLKVGESDQGFVAMWFDERLHHVWRDGILPLEERTGYRMLRIDTVEHNEKICDRILAEVRRSRFLLAELTGQRQSVYFEAGFALGLGLPVIWICFKNGLQQVHFDVRQYNCVVWSTTDELLERLADRILGTIGRCATGCDMA